MVVEPDLAVDPRLGAPELSIVMPCLNEVKTVAHCVDKAFAFLRLNDIAGEVIVADNGSTDGSQTIAASRGARVIPAAEKGYGKALLAGIEAARGTFVIMGVPTTATTFRRSRASSTSSAPVTTWCSAIAFGAGSSPERCRPCTKSSAIRHSA